MLSRLKLSFFSPVKKEPSRDPKESVSLLKKHRARSEAEEKTKKELAFEKEREAAEKAYLARRQAGHDQARANQREALTEELRVKARSLFYDQSGSLFSPLPQLISQCKVLDQVCDALQDQYIQPKIN